MVGSSRTLALLVSCGRCGSLHSPADGLALHPLCGRCRQDGGSGGERTSHVRALDECSVAEAITAASPGSFVLGYVDGSDFVPFYVGRSDSDVGASLRSWIDAPSHTRRHRTPSFEPWRMGFRPTHASGADTAYTHFAFRYARSAAAAFDQQCRDYHELGGHETLDNERHPQPPPDSPCACPLHA